MQLNMADKIKHFSKAFLYRRKIKTIRQYLCIALLVEIKVKISLFKPPSSTFVFESCPVIVKTQSDFPYSVQWKYSLEVFKC